MFSYYDAILQRYFFGSYNIIVACFVSMVPFFDNPSVSLVPSIGLLSINLVLIFKHWINILIVHMDRTRGKLILLLLKHFSSDTRLR